MRRSWVAASLHPHRWRRARRPALAEPAATMSPVTLLALDIGNTSLTLGLFREGELIGSWRATTRAGATPDEAALVRDMLALDARLDELTAVGIASVVPPLTERFVGFAQDRLGLEPMVVDAATLKGILPIEIDPTRRGGRGPSVQRAGRRDRVRRPGDRHRPGHQHELRRDRRQRRLHRRGHRPRTRRLAGGAGRAGPASCRGSSCGARSTPSAPTPSTPCSPARCSGISAWSPAC